MNRVAMTQDERYECAARLRAAINSMAVRYGAAATSCGTTFGAFDPGSVEGFAWHDRARSRRFAALLRLTRALEHLAVGL